MRKASTFRTALVACAALMLPAFASANTIVTTGDLQSGEVNYHHFDVTDSGSFFTLVLSTFPNIHGVLTLAPTLVRISGTGFVTTTFGFLPTGSYMLGVANTSSYWGAYAATITSSNGDANWVPEPGSLVLLGSGLLAIAFFRRRKLYS